MGGQRLTPWRDIIDGDTRKAWRLSEVSVLARRVVDVAPPGAALMRAIAAEVATWPDSYDPPLLVPLQQDGDDWTAKAVALDRKERDVPLTLRYSASSGLRFEP